MKTFNPVVLFCTARDAIGLGPGCGFEPSLDGRRLGLRCRCLPMRTTGLRSSRMLISMRAV